MSEAFPMKLHEFVAFHKWIDTTLAPRRFALRCYLLELVCLQSLHRMQGEYLHPVYGCSNDMIVNRWFSESLQNSSK